MATAQLPQDFKEFLKLLNEEQLEYLMINLPDLLKNKKAADRHKDLDDIEHLSQK
jgi:hypothetical protein